LWSDTDWIVIKFDARLYQGYNDARAALLEVITTELTKTTDGNASLAVKTKKLLTRVDGFRVLGFLAEGAAMFAGIHTGGLIARSVGALSVPFILYGIWYFFIF
jgi:predicted KAP-like P-loop ATPase